MAILKKKKKPKFNVPNAGFKRSVKARWRRPRGIDNKKRIRKYSSGACPKVGYGTPESLRHVHPSGLKEILVHNVNEILKATKENIVRFASGTGMKKRKDMLAKAKELGLKVANKGEQ